MKQRFEVLDIFRGLFSALVVFFHMSAFSDTVILNNAFIDNADLFVDFFFVLSGFVIAYSYREFESLSHWKSFMQKRWLRIYPLHALMLLAFVGMEAGKLFAAGHIHINNPDNINNNWITFFSSLLLVNSVALPGVTDVSWNIPSWSISAELISYFVFSSLWLLLSLAGKGKAAFKNSTAAIMVAVAVTTLWLVKGSFQMNYSYDVGFLRGIAGFFTGVLCLGLFLQTESWFRRQPQMLFHAAELVLLAGIIYFVSKGAEYKPFGFVYEILFFLSVLIFSFERGFISRGAKQVTVLHKMGQYSYSVYMTHAVLLSLFNILFIRVLKLPETSYAYLFLLNYLLIYKVSQFTYKHVEMRFVKSKKGKTLLSQSSVPSSVVMVAS